MKKYEEKTVLVTGATGLIGSNIVSKLMLNGKIRVIALSRSEEKLREGFHEYLDMPNFSYIAQDISCKLKIEENIDYIFHAAGPMENKIIRNRPMDVISPNIQGTINCLEFLRDQEEQIGYKGRLILFSSVTVYGNNTNVDREVKEEDTNITECIELLGAPYSQSKRISEVIALSYLRQFGVESVIARFSTVYGDTKFIPDTAFFEFINKAIKGEDICMNTSGLPRRDNIYVDDAVNGVLLIGSDGVAGEAYNISSGGQLGNFASVDEIATLIADIVNERKKRDIIKVIFKEAFCGARKAGIMLNNEKLQALGWTLKTSLLDGVSKTIEKIEKKNK